VVRRLRWMLQPKRDRRIVGGRRQPRVRHGALLGALGERLSPDALRSRAGARPHSQRPSPMAPWLAATPLSLAGLRAGGRRPRELSAGKGGSPRDQGDSMAPKWRRNGAN
jgi:hypothetical protein